MNINLPMLISLKSREVKRESKHFSIYILINDLKEILSTGVSGLQNMVVVGAIER